jgi:O-antigen ligase
MTACFLLAALGRWLFSNSVRNSILITLLMGGVLLGSGYLMFQYVDLDAIEKRFGNIEKTIQNADQDSRVLSTQATWDMAQADVWLGWGAGSFRYIFPKYQKKYPEIFYQRHHPRRGWIGRKFYHYAHNDVVQFLAEYGIVGCSFLLLAFGYWVCCLLFRASGNAMSALMLLIGLVLALGHACVDFVYQSPMCWLALNGLLCVSVKLFTLHRERMQGRA